MGFVIFIGIVVAIGIVIFSVQAREELNRSWATVADRHNLVLTPANWNVSPRLDGHVAGYPLTIDIEKRGGGQAKAPWTRFRLSLPELDLDLDLKEETFFSTISRSLGNSDIEVGDTNFDAGFNIQGRNPEAIREFLTPARRAAIRRFFAAHRGATISQQEISWSKNGRVNKAAPLLTAIEDLIDLAQSLNTEQAQVPAQLQGQREPLTEIDPAPVVEDAEFEPEPDSEFEAEPEPELAAEPVAETEAGQSEPVSDIEPLDEPEPVVAENAATVVADDTTAVDQFCDTVFASGALSYEAMQAFQRDYQDQEVTWSGVLKAAEPYKFDFVFGAGDGVKATLAIKQLDDHTVGDGEVQAIIALPAGTAGLEDAVGKRLAFSGRLAKVDGLMRKVFVADAQLVA